MKHNFKILHSYLAITCIIVWIIINNNNKTLFNEDAYLTIVNLP